MNWEMHKGSEWGGGGTEKKYQSVTTALFTRWMHYILNDRIKLMASLEYV